MSGKETYSYCSSVDDSTLEVCEVSLSSLVSTIGLPDVIGEIQAIDITNEIITTGTLAIVIPFFLFLDNINPIIARIIAAGRNKKFNSGIIPIAPKMIANKEHTFVFFGGASTICVGIGISFSSTLYPQLEQKTASSANRLLHCLQFFIFPSS